MRRAILAAMLAAGLAACGQKEPEVIVDPAPPSNSGDGGDVLAPPSTLGAPNAPAGATNAPSDGAAAPGAVPATSAAGGAPRRKPGLWQLTASNGQTSATSTLCVSDASEARFDVFDTRRLLPAPTRPGGDGPGPAGPRPGGQGQRRGFGGACPAKVSKEGAGWRSTSRCTREMGDASMTISTNSAVTGDLDTQYTLKASRTVSGAPMEQMNRTTDVTVTGAYKGSCPSGQKGGDLTVGGRTSSVLGSGD